MPDLLEPLDCPVDEVASVPRRFGVGVMMILMTAFAVIFAVMKSFGAPPEVFVVVAVLFFAVTVAQIVLFKGKRPRAASIWAGGVVFPLCNSALVLWQEHVTDPRGFLIVFVVGLILVPVGMLFGYLAGCVMAGIFFVQENWNRRKIPPPEVRLVPLTEADFDTLCQWVENRQLFDLWSQDQFNYPLDAEQLRQHYRVQGDSPICADTKIGTVPDQPKHVAYKAIGDDAQEMVAMVDLANIDRQRVMADIELAIVDPARNDHPLISRCLLRAVVREAFGRQGLQWLRAVIDRRAVQSLACFRKCGFYDVQFRSTEETSAYTFLVRGRLSGYVPLAEVGPASRAGPIGNSLAEQNQH